MPTRATATLARSNVEFLRQGRELIRALDDASFTAPAPGSTRGGVGAHFRHVLDHYSCFVRDWEGGTVDYDHRERDTGLETLRPRAIAKIDELCAALERLCGASALQPVTVLVDCAEPSGRVPSSSTLGRELQFLVSHTVHHYAVIALVLRARGIEPGVDFGVAPSTLKFEQSRAERERGSAACAR